MWLGDAIVHRRECVSSIRRSHQMIIDGKIINSNHLRIGGMVVLSFFHVLQTMNKQSTENEQEKLTHDWHQEAICIFIFHSQQKAGVCALEMTWMRWMRSLILYILAKNWFTWHNDKINFMPTEEIDKRQRQTRDTWLKVKKCTQYIRLISRLSKDEPRRRERERKRKNWLMHS